MMMTMLIASFRKPKSHGKIVSPPTAEHFASSILDGTDEDGCHIEGDSDSSHFQFIDWVDATIDSVFWQSKWAA